MATFYRVLIRLGMLWLGVVALIVVFVLITNWKNLNSDHYINWAMFASPGLIALALAWIVKPA